jgi:hypothetical protein
LIYWLLLLRALFLYLQKSLDHYWLIGVHSYKLRILNGL